MLKLFRPFLLAFPAFVLVPALFAQPAGSVHGVVVDAETAEPLPAAGVNLQEGSTRQTLRAVTGSDGAFTFTGLASGSYTLSVSFVGYGALRREVELTEGQDLDLRLLLEPEIVQINEVVVSAPDQRGTETLTPVTFSNVTAEELAQQPDMKDLPVLLSALPSTTFHSENGNGIGYSTLRIRGFDQRRIGVAINGIPQNDPEDFNVYWVNFFDIQGAVRDIQVQRGAYAAVYGPEAIAGAINIEADPFSWDGRRSYVAAHLGAGTLGTRRYSVEARTGSYLDRFGAFFRYSRLLSDGYREWSWAEFHRFYGSLMWNLGNSSLRLNVAGGAQEDGLAFSGIAKEANADAEARRSNFSALTQDIERFHQPRVELLYTWAPGTDWSVDQALFWTRGAGYFDFGGTFRSADYLRLPAGWRDLDATQRTLPLFLSAPDVGLKFRANLDQWQIGWMPRIRRSYASGGTTLGAELRLHRSQRWGRIQEAAGGGTGEPIPENQIGSGADARVYQFNGEKVIGSLSLSQLYLPAERLAVQGDVHLTYRRYRHFDEQFFGNQFSVPYVFVNPRLGVTLNVGRPLSGYASVALANREPRLKSLYDGEEAGAGFTPQFRRDPDGTLDFANPTVRPERLLDVEVGGAWTRRHPGLHFAGYYGLKANVFWMEFEDEIVPSGGLDQFGVPRSGNAERTRHVGLEVEGEWPLLRFTRHALWVRGNVTLSRNRFVRFTEYVTAPDFSVTAVARDGNPIAGFPEQIANLGLVAYSPAVVLRLDASYAGRQYIDNSGGRGSDGAYDPGLTVDPYVLLNASVTMTPADYGIRALANLELSVDVNNVLNRKLLLYGNVGPTGPQFFPTATRHVFFSARYTLHP